jgi:NAD-dependent deacetylase
MNEIHKKKLELELEQIIETSGNIVFFGGAGVSTESGIPDFRSESGLYKAKAEFGHSPEYLISHTAFKRDTALFFRYYKANLIYTEAKPNNAHRALAKWEAEGKLSAVVTQNIDGLHQQAGSKTVHELHGSIRRNACMDCGAAFDLDYILDEKNCVDRKGKQTTIPYCNHCGGVVKPDVVLYEEPLNSVTTAAASAAIAGADTLIIGGTSLVVYPAAGYVNLFKGNNLVLINKSETGVDHRANLVIREPIGEVLAMFL